MASFNRVIIMGNLTADIDLRSTPGGTSVADVTLAVNDRRKSQAGEWVDEVTFVDVTLGSHRGGRLRISGKGLSGYVRRPLEARHLGDRRSEAK